MTKGQYAYLLLRKLQVYFSCQNSEDRAYLYNFFGKIFNDESVTLDEKSYQRFVDLMDSEIDYAAKKGLRTPTAIYNDENFSNSYALLQNSFSEIGITMEMNGDYYGYPRYTVFTLPSGEQKQLDNLYCQYTSVNSRLSVTDDYFKQMKPYYLLEYEEQLDLFEIGTNAAGYNTRWVYDVDTKTLEITGEGTLAHSNLWNNLGIEEVSTLIIGAGVKKLLKGSLNFKNLIIVDLHSADFELQFEENPYTLATSGSWIVYSDNLAFRNYQHSPNLTIEWRPLSAWLANVVQDGDALYINSTDVTEDNETLIVG